MFAVPTLRPRMKRVVHRRAVALAPHVQSGPISPLLPRNLRFPGRKRAADVVGNLLWERRVGIDRPSAEIERVDVAKQGREAGFRKRNLAHPSRAMASNSAGSSSIGARPAASAS